MHDVLITERSPALSRIWSNLLDSRGDGIRGKRTPRVASMLGLTRNLNNAVRDKMDRRSEETSSSEGMEEPRSPLSPNTVTAGLSSMSRTLSVILDSGSSTESLETPGGKKRHSFDDPGATVHHKNWSKVEFAQAMDEVDKEGSALYEAPLRAQKIVPLMVIGSGAFGTVKLGLHLPTLRLVALKELGLFGRSAEFEQAVMRELRVERNLLVPLVEEGPPTWIHRHLERTGAVQPCSFLANYFGALADRNRRVVTLVLEFMDGGSLRHLVDQGGLHFEKWLAHIAMSIASALDHLHSLKIAHLDVKPSNCLANHRGQVKLADLGLATSYANASHHGHHHHHHHHHGHHHGHHHHRAHSLPPPPSSEQNHHRGRHHRSRNHHPGGSLSYLSPQRLDGDAANFPDDVWAFGVSLLLMACGPTKPFSRPRSHWALLEALMDRPLPTPPGDVEDAPIVTRRNGESQRGFSEEFRDFLAKAMAKEPADRASIHGLLKHPFLHDTNSLRDSATFQQEWQQATGMRPLGAQSGHFQAIVDAIVDGHVDDEIRAEQETQQQTPTDDDDDDPSSTGVSAASAPGPQIQEASSDAAAAERCRRASCPSTLASVVPKEKDTSSENESRSVWRRTSQRLLAHAIQRPPRLSVVCTSLFRSLQHLSNEIGVDPRTLLDAIDTARQRKSAMPPPPPVVLERQTRQVSFAPDNTDHRSSKRSRRRSDPTVR